MLRPITSLLEPAESGIACFLSSAARIRHLRLVGGRRQSRWLQCFRARPVHRVAADAAKAYTPPRPVLCCSCLLGLAPRREGAAGAREGHDELLRAWPEWFHRSGLFEVTRQRTAAASR